MKCCETILADDESFDCNQYRRSGTWSTLRVLLLTYTWRGRAPRVRPGGSGDFQAWDFCLVHLLIDPRFLVRVMSCGFLDLCLQHGVILVKLYHAAVSSFISSSGYSSFILPRRIHLKLFSQGPMETTVAQAKQMVKVLSLLANGSGLRR